MLLRVQRVLLACLLAGLTALGIRAGEFKLIDGSTIYGDVSAFDENGVIFRLRTGGFSERVSWGKFDQDALKALAQNARAKEYAEPFIELAPEARVRPKPKPVVLKEVTRVELPTGRTTFFSSFTAPMGLLMLAVLYAANLLAAFEIAKYRNRPPAVVCGLSALLPLVGPLVFLVSPTLGAPEELAEAEPPVMTPPAPVVAGAASPAAATSRSLGAVGVPPPSTGTSLKVAAGAKAEAGGKVEAKTYGRGEYTFNRRFIETQFSGFFRIVPSEAEKDLVLVVKTAKHQYLAKRISRISSNDMFLQPLQTGGKEISVGFNEIVQIEVRHKDDVG